LLNLAKTTLKKYSSRFLFPYLIFQYPTKYCFVRIRNIGRIKRKIRRKLMRMSSIDV
jgi:hypothetical protein